MSDMIDVAITRRITDSPLSITLVFPPVIPVVSGSVPGTAPLHPLTGPTTSREVIEDVPTPGETSVIMPCLWLDVATGGELTDRTTEEARRFQQLGWIASASAVARVLVSDAADDPTDPYGDTKFKRCSYVTYRNQPYRVLQVVPFSSGSKLPITYHVWLVGDRE